MDERTSASRHRIRDSSPGSLRSSTLPLGHGSSPHWWIITSERGRNNENGKENTCMCSGRVKLYCGRSHINHVRGRIQGSGLPLLGSKTCVWKNASGRPPYPSKAPQPPFKNPRSSPVVACFSQITRTRDVGPTLVYCWPTVYDAVPTVNQYWANISGSDMCAGKWGGGGRRNSNRYRQWPPCNICAILDDSQITHNVVVMTTTADRCWQNNHTSGFP